MYKVLILGSKPLLVTRNPKQGLRFLEELKVCPQRFWLVDQKDKVVAYTEKGTVKTL